LQIARFLPWYLNLVLADVTSHVIVYECELEVENKRPNNLSTPFQKADFVFTFAL